MWRIRTTAVLTGLLLWGMTGCAGDDTQPSASPSSPRTGSAPTVSASPSAAAPNCVTGQWRATGVTAFGDFGGAGGTINGGTGATMTVAPDGITEVNFTGSKPLTFSVQVAGGEVQGQVAYHGSIRGAVKFEPAEAQRSGRWNPEGQVTADNLRATVRLTEPVAVTLLDNGNLSDLTPGEQTRAGGVVDIQPVLRGGTYTCEGDRLRVQTQENGPAVLWSFNRA